MHSGSGLGMCPRGGILGHRMAVAWLGQRPLCDSVPHTFLALRAQDVGVHVPSGLHSTGWGW
jgi:hypothetical protein